MVWEINTLSSCLSFYCYSGVLWLLSLSGSVSSSLALMCYLHNCLSPPLAAGEVELSQRYRGNTDWWSRYLCGSRTSSIATHRHDKFQGTNYNGLINLLWGNGNIVNTYKLMEDIEPYNGTRLRGLLYPLFRCTDTRKGCWQGNSKSCQGCLTMHEREVSDKSAKFQM